MVAQVVGHVVLEGARRKAAMTDAAAEAAINTLAPSTCLPTSPPLASIPA